MIIKIYVFNNKIPKYMKKDKEKYVIKISIEISETETGVTIESIN